MPRWSQDEFAAYLRKVSGSKSEQDFQHEPMGEAARETQNPTRIRVRITSWRVQSVDPDNLCPKYFIDCLRYAQIIPNDRDQDIALEIGQRKVERKEDELTVIEIERP